MKQPIDFVILWVDSADALWQAEYIQYYRKVKKIDTTGTGEHRYRDYGSLRYLLRSLDQYAPWVNKIYLVTAAQWPAWLTEVHPKLVRIDHSEIFENRAWLPTFSSRAIQTQLHNIPDLAEHFVLFDDDMVLLNSVEETDFFVNGLPLYSVIFQEKRFDSSHHFIRTLENCHRHTFGKLSSLDRLLVGVNVGFGWKQNYNNVKVFNAHRGNVSIRYDHFCRPYLKSTFKHLIEAMPVVRETAARRFRSEDDVNQELFKLWQVCSRHFHGARPSRGGYLSLTSDVDLMKDRLDKLVSAKCKYACINDTVQLRENADEVFSLVRSNLEKKFPRPSQFEMD